MILFPNKSSLSNDVSCPIAGVNSVSAFWDKLSSVNVHLLNLK